MESSRGFGRNDQAILVGEGIVGTPGLPGLVRYLKVVKTRARMGVAAFSEWPG